MLHGNSCTSFADEITQRASLLFAKGPVELKVEIEALDPEDMG